jgi:hypothetical protein
MDRPKTFAVIPKVTLEDGYIERSQATNAAIRPNHVRVGMGKVPSLRTQSLTNHVSIFNPLSCRPRIRAEQTTRIVIDMESPTHVAINAFQTKVEATYLDRLGKCLSKIDDVVAQEDSAVAIGEPFEKSVDRCHAGRSCGSKVERLVQKMA